MGKRKISSSLETVKLQMFVGHPDGEVQLIFKSFLLLFYFEIRSLSLHDNVFLRSCDSYSKQTSYYGYQPGFLLQSRSDRWTK